MIWLLALSLGWYGWVVLRRWLVWQRMPNQAIPAYFSPTTPVTVIIPVRNEAEHLPHLLRDLARQNYPMQLLQVLVIDDHSEDNTLALAKATQAPYTLTVLELSNYVNQRGKKAAVQLGVQQATGELLMFTDGDCRVGPEWLRAYAHLYGTDHPCFISGPVCFSPTPTAFARMQLVEFASLIGIGGASIGMGKPNMCNGANLAYTKEAFTAVGGFAGNEHIASGDDEFLLHKVDKSFPGRVNFLKNSEAIVYTEPRKSLVSFVQQRVRWASKWKSYRNVPVQLVALCVFVVNLLLFLAIPALLWWGLSLEVFLAAYLAKFVIDFLFLETVLRFMRRRAYLWYMLPLQLVYVPYVLVTALLGLTGRYRWKGRTINTP